MEKARVVLGFATLIVIVVVVVIWVYHPFTKAPTAGLSIQPPAGLNSKAPTQFVLHSTPTPTPIPCKRVHQTAGFIPLTVSNLKVPDGCVLVVNSDQGSINGISWSSGGVLAFHPGTYNGLLTSGEYDVVGVNAGNQLYCSFVDQRSKKHQVLSRRLLLPEWNNC